MPVSSFVLVVYLSVGALNTAGTATTGGPFAVQGYASQEACVDDSKRFAKMEHYDFSVCVASNLPPAPVSTSATASPAPSSAPAREARLPKP